MRIVTIINSHPAKINLVDEWETFLLEWVCKYISHKCTNEENLYSCIRGVQYINLYNLNY